MYENCARPEEYYLMSTNTIVLVVIGITISQYHSSRVYTLPFRSVIKLRLNICNGVLYICCILNRYFVLLTRRFVLIFVIFLIQYHYFYTSLIFTYSFLFRNFQVLYLFIVQSQNPTMKFFFLLLKIPQCVQPILFVIGYVITQTYQV